MTSARTAVTRSGAMRVLGALALGTLSSCSGCATEPETLATGEEFVVLPKIVYIQPSEVGPGTPFRLEVVSRSSVANPTDPEPLVWTASDPAVVIVPDHTNGTALITVPALPQGDNVVITARNGTRSATSLILSRLVSSAGWDEVRDELVDGVSPSVSLLTGAVASGCAHDRIDAFNGSAIIGQLGVSTGCDRADAAIFSEGAAPLIKRPAAWTALQDVIDATGNGGAISIPTQLVIGVDAADAPAATTNEGDYLLAAGDTYRMSRSGIALLASAQTVIREALPDMTTCTDVAALGPTVAPNPKSLNIYHLTTVTAGGVKVRGLFCAPNVILINHTWALTTTLAHEIGHALGLISPSSGHTTYIDGFIRDNLMSTTADVGNDYRHRLSLGQLYRIHVDGRSWLRRNPDLTDGPFLCSCDPYATNVCPTLPADLRPLLASLPPAGGTCP